MAPTLADDLALASSLVRDGVRHAREVRAAGLERREKPDGSLVTQADLAVEAALRAALAERRPRDCVLGEEEGGDADDAGRQWVLDPVDGTALFATGQPGWSCLLALRERGRLLVGAIADGERDVVYAAAAGLGAFRQGSRVLLPRRRALAEARVSTCPPIYVTDDETRAVIDELSRRARSSFADDGAAVMAVLDGRADLAVTDEASRLWDKAAACVIVREAGGTLLSFDGDPDPGDGRGGVACSPGLDAEVREALAAVRPR